jgi:putative DNA primase/helicase
MSATKKRGLPVTIPGDLTLVEGERFPGSLKSPKSDTSPFEPFSDHGGSDAQNPRNQLTNEKSEGTEGTGGTASNGAAFSSSPAKNTEGTEGTGMDLDESADPLHEADDDVPEKIDISTLEMPCYLVRDDWFEMGGSKRKPGVWFCYMEKGKGKDAKPDFKAVRICSPLHIVGLTNTEDGQLFGRLLRFRDSLGCWRTWAMPMEMLRGSCEELRGELLASGVEIEQRNRAQLADYLQWRTPRDVITAVTRTGWTQNGGAFVLRDRVLGADNVYFQSESLLSESAARVGGDYRQWQQMAGYCEGNPVLIVSVCVPLAGPLLAKVQRDSGGVHWVGDSSIGKTTALCVGASVWGGDDFKRTWRATGNGLEGVAAQLSDTCLCLDEINEADPRDIGAIVYSLGNGIGKSRASRIGSARQVHRWRDTLLSTGERSISAMMQEGGKQAKAGQLVRLLNIPAARQFGIFDTLHQFADGRQMADYFKAESAKHYGHAGVMFVEHLIKQENADFGAILAKIETQFEHTDSQAARAASRFAVYAMAGELAIEADILPWKQGAALDACKTMFAQWLALHGSGATEHRQILQAVRDYILKHGDTRFTDKRSDHPPKTERAGWYMDGPGGRIYLFTPAALREAGGNYDFSRVLSALDGAGWIAEHDTDKRSKKTPMDGGNKTNLYWIRPDEDSGHA